MFLSSWKQSEDFLPLSGCIINRTKVQPFLFEGKLSQQMAAGRIKQAKEANNLGGNYQMTSVVRNQAPDE